MSLVKESRTYGLTADLHVVQLLVATGQGNIAYLEMKGGKLKQVAHHKLEVEVACLDLTPVGQNLC